MIHYYLQKGFKPEYILNLSYTEKLFFQESMKLELERQEKIMKTMIF